MFLSMAVTYFYSREVFHQMKQSCNYLFISLHAYDQVTMFLLCFSKASFWLKKGGEKREIVHQFLSPGLWDGMWVW